MPPKTATAAAVAGSVAKRSGEEIKGSNQKRLKFVSKDFSIAGTTVIGESKSTQIDAATAMKAARTAEADEAAYVATLPKLTSCFRHFLPYPTVRRHISSASTDLTTPLAGAPTSSTTSLSSATLATSSATPVGETKSCEGKGEVIEGRGAVMEGKLAPVMEEVEEVEEEGLLIQEWHTILRPEFKRKYWVKLCVELDKLAHMGRYIIPSIDIIFSALNLCPPSTVKVVLVGQDPYPSPQNACGCSFSVPHGVRIPESLQRVFQELKNDIPGYKVPNHGCLEHWCKQGVLLLNSILTTTAQQCNAHKDLGWEKFTDAIIHWAGNRKSNLVFMLWGSTAQKKCSSVPFKKHLILKCCHPSPKVNGMIKFLGCKHFSKANAYLIKHKNSPIHW